MGLLIGRSIFSSTSAKTARHAATSKRMSDSGTFTPVPKPDFAQWSQKKLVEELRDLKRRGLGSPQNLIRDERFQYPLGAALFLLGLEALLSERLTRKKKWLGRFL